MLTRDPDWSADGVLVAHDLDAALALADDLPGDVMSPAAPRCTPPRCRSPPSRCSPRSHQSPEGDTFYPDFDRNEWVEANREHHDGFDRVWWTRRPVAG